MRIRGRRTWLAATAISVLCTGCGSSASSDRPYSDPQPAGSSADVEQAELALRGYLDAAREGRYEAAMAQYVGEWKETSASWFEKGDTLSGAQFLREACKGLLFCYLEVGRVATVSLHPPDTIRFMLELREQDGSRFEPPPCCGDRGAPDTLFVFDVVRRPSGFVQANLPVYRP